jgi:hypothetical protein
MITTNEYRPLGLPVLSQTTVYRRHPKTQRLTVTRYKLAEVDGLRPPVLLTGDMQWRAVLIDEGERVQLLVSRGRTLKPIPKGTLG